MLAHYDKAAVMGPDFADTYLMRGMCLLLKLKWLEDRDRLSFLDHAESDFTKCKGLQPGFAVDADEYLEQVKDIRAGVKARLAAVEPQGGLLRRLGSLFRYRG